MSLVGNVIAQTWHGTMIVNRLDRLEVAPDRFVGVGFQLLNYGEFDRAEVELVVNILKTLSHLRGRRLMAYDLGANLGCHCLVWGRELKEKLHVHALEAQPRIFWNLCGNVSLNNLMNVLPVNAAVGGSNGQLTFPAPRYDRLGSFGSLELRQSERSENIGQPVGAGGAITVPMVRLDAISKVTPDFIKMDIEGMENEVLEAAKPFIDRVRPIILFERVKSDMDALENLFRDINYKVIEVPMNGLAVPNEDAFNNHLAIMGNPKMAK